MNYLLLLALLSGAAAARAQTGPRYRPETDGAYYNEQDRAAAANRRPFGTPLDSTLTGLAALDARNGFRAYVFGTPIRQYPAMRRFGNDVYLARQEPRLIGNTPISVPLFRTKDGVLAAVEFSASGRKNIRYLLETLTAQYGQPQESGIEKMVWRGRVSTLVFVTNAVNFSAPVASIRHLRGTVIIYNNALAAREQAVKAASTRRATGDL